MTRWGTVGGAPLAFVVLAAIVQASCTTYIGRAACGSEPFRCGDGSDVKFCEIRAVAVQGTDCARAGVGASKSFCFVSQRRCARTTYAVRGMDCRVIDYEPVGVWPTCSPGLPVFTAQ